MHLNVKLESETNNVESNISVYIYFKMLFKKNNTIILGQFL